MQNISNISVKLFAKKWCLYQNLEHVNGKLAVMIRQIANIGLSHKDTSMQTIEWTVEEVKILPFITLLINHSEMFTVSCKNSSFFLRNTSSVSWIV